MASEFAISVYFRDGDTSRTVDYSMTPASAPFEHALTVFSLHTVRALSNTSHTPHGQRLAQLLVNRRDVVETFVDDPYYEIAPFDGRTDKMRVTVQAKIEEDRAPYFNMKIKGFGIFNENSTISCVRSVGLHFSYLTAAYGRSSSEAEQLVRAAELCGSAALSDKLTIRSQVPMALEIAKAATGDGGTI